MSTVAFSFEKNKDYGIGYKAYKTKIINGKRELYGPLTKHYQNQKISKNKWLLSSKIGSIYSDDDKSYNPGFHIFLNQQDAENYYSYKNNVVIVRVKFKDVVGFGTNGTSAGILSTAGPCIIARKMLVEKVVKDFSKS